MLKVPIFTQYFSAHPNYCSRLFKQFIFEQKDKTFTLCRIISFPFVLFPLMKLGDMNSPLCSQRCECPNTVLSGEGRSVPIFQESDVCKTPRGLRRLRCLTTQGGCDEFSSPLKMTPGNIVWASVIRTFISLVPLFNWADIFPKLFPNPALLRGV